MRCIDCDFDLAHAAGERRCPECGRAFDPGDAGTVIGPGHGRAARFLARAPGWPLAVGAVVVALVVASVDFSPSGSFGRSLSMLVALLAFGFVWLWRAVVAAIAHRMLPRRRPRVVPVAPARWVLPVAIVLVAFGAKELRLPRAVAFRLDRARLEVVATGPAIAPSAWRPVAAMSGTVARGGVWLDAAVWDFDGDDTRRWTRETGLTPFGWALKELFVGEREVPGMRAVPVARIAVFPIAGLCYGNFSDPAWAYAPGAPDGFGFGEESVYWYRRYEGDWFVSEGWIRELTDGAGTAVLRAAGPGG